MTRWERWFGLRRRPSLGLFLVAGCVLLVLAPWRTPAPPPGAAPPDGGAIAVARVVDGDTLLLITGHRVRLIGVNTPETKHPERPVERLGAESAAFLARQVEGRVVMLEYDRERVDDYGRILAYVFLDGRMLNAEIIRAGYSRAQTRFPYRPDRQRLFLEAEQEARAAGRGLWAVQKSE